MKRTFIYTFIALFAMVSCQKGESTPDKPVDDPLAFSASIDAGGTKTALK